MDLLTFHMQNAAIPQLPAGRHHSLYAQYPGCGASGVQLTLAFRTPILAAKFTFCVLDQNQSSSDKQTISKCAAAVSSFVPV